MHSNGTLLLDTPLAAPLAALLATPLDAPLDAQCGYALKQIKEQIEKFKEEYQVPSDILDFPYIDLDYVFLILVSA